MELFHIFEEYETDEIRDRLGWALGWEENVNINMLTEAIMVLCETIERLEKRVQTLEQSK